MMAAPSAVLPPADVDGVAAVHVQELEKAVARRGDGWELAIGLCKR